MKVQPEVSRTGSLLFHLSYHLLIRVDVDVFRNFREFKQVGCPGGHGGGYRNVQFASLGGHCVNVHEQRAYRACYGYVSCTEDIAVECLSLLLAQIDAFYLVDLYPGVKAHVLEILPVDASAHASCSCEPVPYAYAVEMDSGTVYMEASVGIIRHIGESNLEHAVLQPGLFA